MVSFQSLQQSIPKVRGIPIVATAERIFQPVTDFIRGNPIVATAITGVGTTGLIAGVAAVRARTKRKKSTKKKTTTKRRTTSARRPRKGKKKTQAQIKAQRLRNLAKARRARKTGKRRVIRGRGLGTHEIRHSGKSTRGKFKVVSFRDKRTGKMVRFKAKR